jgi:hypothetical protein
MNCPRSDVAVVFRALTSQIGIGASAVIRRDVRALGRCRRPHPRAICTICFFDRTKAHRQRCCTQAVCGNRAKVAAFASGSGSRSALASHLFASARRPRHDRLCVFRVSGHACRSYCGLPPVRVGNPVEGIAPADGYREFTFHLEVERICESDPEDGRPEQRNEGESNQGLVLEDKAEQFRHSHLKTLVVERAVDDDLPKRGQRLKAVLAIVLASPRDD